MMHEHPCRVWFRPTGPGAEWALRSGVPVTADDHGQPDVSWVAYHRGGDVVDLRSHLAWVDNGEAFLILTSAHAVDLESITMAFTPRDEPATPAPAPAAPLDLDRVIGILRANGLHEAGCPALGGVVVLGGLVRTRCSCWLAE